MRSKPDLKQEQLHNTLSVVSHATGIPVEDILSRTRRQDVADARHITMYLLDRRANKQTISVALDRDRRTLYHAVDKVTDLMNSYDGYRMMVATINHNLERVEASVKRSSNLTNQPISEEEDAPSLVGAEVLSRAS